MSITPNYLVVLGIAAAYVAKENPDPKRSRNKTFANWVILLGLSTKVNWLVKVLGPNPPTFM